MRQICFRAGSRGGSIHTQWLLSHYFKDTGQHDREVMPECTGGTFLLGQVDWEGNRNGRGHTAVHVASVFLGTWR